MKVQAALSALFSVDLLLGQGVPSLLPAWESEAKLGAAEQAEHSTFSTRGGRLFSWVPGEHWPELPPLTEQCGSHQRV